MFVDRVDAGRQLAERLRHFANDPNAVVVGLPRGGVPVAREVARSLWLDLDVIIVRKLGVPSHPELAMGQSGRTACWWSPRRSSAERTCGATNSTTSSSGNGESSTGVPVAIAQTVRRRRCADRVVVVVDDGIATGSTARAACDVARAGGAQRIVLAVPVAPRDWQNRLGHAADDYVAVDTPADFGAVGRFYQDFSATPDREVIRCLRDVRVRTTPDEATGTAQPASSTGADGGVEIALGDDDAHHLSARLDVPADPIGGVVFAHGSGSSRHSVRNRRVAAHLNEARLATLLIDLLTPSEQEVRSNVFDVELLGGRLTQATAWVSAHPTLRDLPVGYFGASTGAAAALWSASVPGATVAAVVSRGGRPDLAADRLPFMAVPTLLIVGGQDTAVLDLNRRASAAMRCRSELAIVPGATHLFEETGALELVADLARDWFVEHFTALR